MLWNGSRSGARSGWHADHPPLPASGGGTSLTIPQSVLNHYQMGILLLAESHLTSEPSQKLSRMMCCVVQHMGNICHADAFLFVFYIANNLLC